MAKISTVAIVVITRDHFAFIGECLASIDAEFGPETPLFIVDVGSIDGTSGFLEIFKENNKFQLKLIKIDRKNSPLKAFQTLTSHIKTDFISVISGDDFFLPGYGSKIRNLVESNLPNLVVHFSQTIVNEKSDPIGKRSPTWTSNRLKDRKKLLYSNPGTTAGCLLPWDYLKNMCLNVENFDTLIEDYYFNSKLIDQIPFVSDPNELVAYRLHKGNLSKQKIDKDYAKSIGICIALSWQSAQNTLEKILAFSLFARWGRHVSVSRFPQVLMGFLKKSL